ncbi:MAG: chromosome partitioning protein ParA [Ruminiclostridium sp.]|nr:chromosome partitioning protein ParA [Ruminiclostridium sp.]
MKIKLALLDSDLNYLSRIVSAFNTKYPEKFEIYSFTKYENAMSELESSHIDVLVASDYFDVDVSRLPKRCGFAYFVDSSDIDSINNQRAICKFQKADLIYRQILSIYSENASAVSGLKLTDDSCKVIAFTSPSGGVGSSVMAASCALHFAAQSKKTLYLNFEKLGSSDLYFNAEGQFDISDIIFALKSKNSNLAMKMESCVKQDSRGVYFFSKPKVALDMLELGTDEIIRLVADAKLSGNYSYIILDIDFDMDPGLINILRQTNAVIWTGDGSEISNLKIKSAYDALTILDGNADSQLLNRTMLIYNKFSNKSSTAVQGVDLKNIGGAPRYEHATTAQILEQLMTMDMFDKID